jgi:transposase
VPALPPYLIEPIWQQFKALLPEHRTDHPLGCHRSRIPERVVFEKLVQILVFGCAYERIADASCSESTLRRRRDEWIELGMMERLREICLDAYDHLIGLEISEVAVDCCITKAPCGGEKAGRSPVDRGKRGIKRSIAVDASGIPLGAVSAPANCHDSPLLVPPGPHPGGGVRGAWGAARGDERPPRPRLRLASDPRASGGAGALRWEISGKGKPAPFWASRRWGVERTSSWHNAHKKLVWCTERVGKVIDFWVAFSDVVIIVRRLAREGWTRYRWEGRPSRRP